MGIAEPLKDRNGNGLEGMHTMELYGPVDKNLAVETFGTGRVCADCGCNLSRYNPDKKCWQCESTHKRHEVERYMPESRTPRPRPKKKDKVITKKPSAVKKPVDRVVPSESVEAPEKPVEAASEAVIRPNMGDKVPHPMSVTETVVVEGYGKIHPPLPE